MPWSSRSCSQKSSEAQGPPILHDVLKAEGLVQNHKRTERLYREEGLSLRRKHRRKLPAIARVPLPQPTAPNQRWSMDFIHDQLACGRRFRCLTLVDDFTRQCLALHVDTSIGGAAVVTILDQLATSRGLPASITTDNDPEFTGRALHLWAQSANVSINHIQPGKPMQNAFIETLPAPSGAALRAACGRLSRSARINGTFRDDCLNQHWFTSLAEARLLIEHWRAEYNHLRPHSSIGRIPPDSFALMFPLNNPHSTPLA